MRYIGSKTRIADEILDVAGQPIAGECGDFVDAFCGTGVVASAASQRGWRVRINDHLTSATTIATASLLSSQQVGFAHLGGYSRAIEILQDLSSRAGFIWREYSPASSMYGAARIRRMYFTEENAGVIDAIRYEIALWKSQNLINESEESLLLADLLLAANRVANISGTYGCFLREWQPSALKPLALVPRKLPDRSFLVESTCADVFGISTKSSDLIYLDPPYTKRQYAAYYHILETICKNDEPQVDGVSGLRPWKNFASDFCYKRKALNAIVSLIRTLKSSRVLLSYSSEGHVKLEEITAALNESHFVQVHQLGKIGRYRPNRTAASKNDSVSEFLLDIRSKQNWSS